MSIEVFSFAVIGGLGSITGAIAGVALFRVLDFVLAKYAAGSAATILRLSLTGAGLLVILYFLPGGLWQFVHRRRDRYLRGSPTAAASWCRAWSPTGGSTTRARPHDDDRRRGRDRR